MKTLDKRLAAARTLSWRNFGRRITFYLPGMFCVDGTTGKYPALSITGNRCALQCDHCGGSLLNTMISASDPDTLEEKCLHLADRGNHGVLISGGCDQSGRLPWERFTHAIATIKAETPLFVSIHSGLIDDREAVGLKQAGVDQALIDVVGDDETFRKMYHLPFGIGKIRASMAALQKAGLPMVPHIICGLDYGRIRAEKNAIAMISGFNVQQVVIVSLMAIPGTAAGTVPSPQADAVADIIAEARFQLPYTPISLGCARRRGSYRLETLAIDAGVNRMALPSDEAIARAKRFNLEIRYRKTCCSVTRGPRRNRQLTHKDPSPWNTIGKRERKAQTTCA